MIHFEITFTRFVSSIWFKKSIDYPIKERERKREIRKQLLEEVTRKFKVYLSYYIRIIVKYLLTCKCFDNFLIIHFLIEYHLKGVRRYFSRVVDVNYQRQPETRIIVFKVSLMFYLVKVLVSTRRFHPSLHRAPAKRDDLRPVAKRISRAKRSITKKVHQPGLELRNSKIF